MPRSDAKYYLDYNEFTLEGISPLNDKLLNTTPVFYECELRNDSLIYTTVENNKRVYSEVFVKDNEGGYIGSTLIDDDGGLGNYTYHIYMIKNGTIYTFTYKENPADVESLDDKHYLIFYSIEKEDMLINYDFKSQTVFVKPSYNFNPETIDKKYWEDVVQINYVLKDTTFIDKGKMLHNNLKIYSDVFENNPSKFKKKWHKPTYSQIW